MKLARLRGKLAYQTLLLGAAALVTSAVLALADRLTAPDIRAAEARDLRAALAEVLPGQYENDLLADVVPVATAEGEMPVYRARRDGRVQAVVFEVSGRGYAGPVVCMLGVDRDGRVLGVRVLRHKETPGLGDKIDPAKDPWIHGFAGKSLGNPAPERWAVAKDGGVFDSFTGATITPRAVVGAVRGGLELFARERGRLLDAPAPMQTAEPVSTPTSG